ncbi:MAG: protein kinase domain-containing protein, partial [Actinomycetota bacterium]
MTGLDDVPRVPGYRTDRLLGFGGTGEVWAAVTEDGGEPVALKVLRVPEEETDRLLRETALLRRVDHPHVVRLRTVARVPGHGPVLVLDRALGGSLGALVSARGPLDVGEVVTVLTPLAGALADLHERGLVHG